MHFGDADNRCFPDVRVLILRPLENCWLKANSTLMAVLRVSMRYSTTSLILMEPIVRTARARIRGLDLSTAS